MPVGPTSLEIAALAGEIRRLGESGKAIPRLPFEVLQALRGLVPLPVVELGIVGQRGGLLLTWREDENWRGWHFPGGFMAPWESVSEACKRIARSEVGADFVLEGIAGVESWPDHPYAAAVSILCRGKLDGAPVKGSFFAQPPKDIVDTQISFFKSLSAGNLVAADLMRREQE